MTEAPGHRTSGRRGSNQRTAEPDPRNARSPAGLIVVDKPAGWTSHQVVGRCRRVVGTRKVGHAGTLDPMATGVLLIGIGRATRLLGHLMLTVKEYTATIRLGIDTVTDDADGDITRRRGATRIDETAVRTALPRFTGDIMQVPSAVSAVKIDGRRAYARVRAGEDVVLAARPVTVHRCVLVRTVAASVAGADGDPALPVLDCDVVVLCSSGTYIRALARDLGDLLGTGGHLTALRRTRVGPFGLDRAEPVSAETTHLGVLDLATVARECFPSVDVEERAAAAVAHGRPLPDLAITELTAVLRGDRFLGLYQPDGQGGAKPEAVFV